LRYANGDIAALLRLVDWVDMLTAHLKSEAGRICG
jgi:hypothetical protein